MTDIESFIDQLANLSSDYKLAYNSLRQLKGEIVKSSLIQKRNDYINIHILFMSCSPSSILFLSKYEY